MKTWTNELKEIEILHSSKKGQFPFLDKELEQLLKTDDANVVMLYARRCLEVIVTDLCEIELKRPRKTEPLKGIIDKLNSEEKVPSHIIGSMHGLNTLSTYGTHPKDFDPEQVKPVLNNLGIVIKWYLKYLEFRKVDKLKNKDITTEFAEEPGIGNGVLQKPGKKFSRLFTILFLVIVIGVCVSIIFLVAKPFSRSSVLEKSVAVLPFINDSPDDSTQYFLDGVMEELLTKLQAIKDLRIISRTSVEQYRGQTKSIPEIAKELGVNYIVEGSGQKSGNSFRLRIQLIMAREEKHLWAKPFDQKNITAIDYFNIQNQVAENIVTELNAVLTPKEKQLLNKIPTERLDAYEAYLKGQFYWRKLTPGDLDIALHFFEMARDKDPDYALAYAGISEVWVGRQQAGYSSPDEAGPKAFEAITKALEIDSTLADVHYTLALINTWGMWDWGAGEKAFKKAIDFNPNHAEAHIYYSQLLLMLGRPEEASEVMEKGIKMDPFNSIIKGIYGMNLYMLHRNDEAIAAAQEALKIDPNSIVALGLLSDVLPDAGRYQDALEVSKLFLKLVGFEEILPAIDAGYVKAGFKGACLQAAEALVEISKTKFVLPNYIFNTYAWADQKEKALDYLEKMFEIHDPNLPYITAYPLFTRFRNEPRYMEIVKKMNLSINEVIQ